MESRTGWPRIVLGLAIGLIGLVCFRATAAGLDGGLIAEVTLTAGKATKITNVTGSVTCTDSDGGRIVIPFQNIQSLELAKKGVTILLVDGQSISGTFEPFSVEGEGDFGSLTVKSTSISSVVFSNHAQKQEQVRAAREPSADLQFANGNIRRVTGVYFYGMECADGGFSLHLSLDKLTKLEIGNGGGLKVLLVDGHSLSCNTKPFTITGDVEFGSITYNSKDVVSVAFPKNKPQVDAQANSGIQLSLNSTEGSSIVGRIDELRLGLFNFKIDAANITAFNYPVEGNRVLVQTGGIHASTFTWEVSDSQNSRLSGSFVGGQFDIEYVKLAAMTLVRSSSNPASAASPKSPHSPTLIEDVYGNRVESYDTLAINLPGDFDVFFPSTRFQAEHLQKDNLSIIVSGEVRYLVDAATILRNGLRFVNGTWTLDVGDRTIIANLGSNYSLSGKSQIGEFRIAGQQVRTFSDSEGGGNFESRYAASTADVTVKTRDDQTVYLKSPVMNADNTLRPGWYVSGGGRLYRLTYQQLPIKTDTNEELWVSFDKIRSITPSEGYKTDKMVRIMSRTGQELVGSINLQAAKESTNQTFLSDEGIVGKISPSIYVFVPFDGIRSLEFIQK